MADLFDDDNKNDLYDRGFNNGQVEFLESLDTDKDDLYSDICKLMDDYDDMTPQQVIDFLTSNEEEYPQQGGKRKNKKSRKGRKGRKSRKSRKGRKGRKSRKSRR